MVLPFGDPPSTSIPTIDQMREDIVRGVVWKWNYKGIDGYITPDMLSNALQVYDSMQQGRYRRERIPAHVGVLLWRQTLDQYPDQMLTDEAGDETDAAAQPDQRPFEAGEV